MRARKIISLITVLFVCLCAAGYILPEALEKASSPEPVLPGSAEPAVPETGAEAETKPEPPRRRDEPSPSLPQPDLPKALQRQPDTGFIWIEHDPAERSPEITPSTTMERLLPAAHPASTPPPRSPRSPAPTSASRSARRTPRG